MAKQRKPIPKTQKEISKQLQEPYVPPVDALGFSPTGNPNDTNNINRASQTSFRDDTVKPLVIGLEDLDWAIMYYFQNVIKPTVKQNEELLSVPVIYGSPEKWASFQKQGYLRDLQGRLMAPLLMFKRNNIEKNRSLTNKLDANNPHNVAVTGKKGGWVDCNSPIRKDGEITGYKSCGREKGEERSKYPSCRPTAAQCKTPGKGKTWGKTKWTVQS